MKGEGWGWGWDKDAKMQNNYLYLRVICLFLSHASLFLARSSDLTSARFLCLLSFSILSMSNLLVIWNTSPSELDFPSLGRGQLIDNAVDVYAREENALHTALLKGLLAIPTDGWKALYPNRERAHPKSEPPGLAYCFFSLFSYAILRMSPMCSIRGQSQCEDTALYPEDDTVRCVTLAAGRGWWHYFPISIQIITTQRIMVYFWRVFFSIHVQVLGKGLARRKISTWFLLAR